MNKKIIFAMFAILANVLASSAQSVTKYTTVVKNTWVISKSALSGKAEGTVVATVDGSEKGSPAETRRPVPDGNDVQ